MNVVAAMIVYESLRRRGRRLVEDVVESSLQVPFDLMIIVDDGSDGTGAFIKRLLGEHGRSAVILGSRVTGGGRPTRATARQTALNYFLEETGGEWIFFIDDDAVLRPGWWDEARAHAEDDAVGLIWGIDWPSNARPGDAGVREFKVRAFLARGGMHDTMIRRAAVEDIPPIPPALHVFEDAWIYWAVRCKGWEVRIVEAGAVHYGGDDPFVNAGPKGIMEAYRLLGVIGDYRPRARRDYANPVLPFLLMARPILGFLAGLPKALLERRLAKHARIQFDKLRLRYHTAIARLRYGPPPHPCNAFRGRGPQLKPPRPSPGGREGCGRLATCP